MQKTFQPPDSDRFHLLSAGLKSTENFPKKWRFYNLSFHIAPFSPDLSVSDKHTIDKACGTDLPAPPDSLSPNSPKSAQLSLP